MIDPMQLAQTYASAQMTAQDPLRPGIRGINPAMLENIARIAAQGGGQAPEAMPAGQPAPQPMGFTQPPQAPQGGGFGDFLGGLFNPEGAKTTRVATALMKEGLPPNQAMLVASDKGLLRNYVQTRMSGTKPVVINDKLVDPSTGRVIGDYRDDEEDKDLINAGRGRLYDPNKGEWITAPDMGVDAPTVQTFYDNEGREYKAQWNQQERTWEPVGGSKLPSGTSLQVSPDGTVKFVQGGGAGQKLTEAQGKDLVNYTRALDAESQLALIDTQLADFKQQNAAWLPLGVGNYLRTPEFRQAKQAADVFLTAVLRKDTGAAITDQEFQIYGPMFLPVPGDDPGTIDQKRRARQVALVAINSGLGTAEALGEANRVLLGSPDPRKGINDAPTANVGGGEQTDATATVERARSAIERGADPALVRQRLQKLGIDPSVLDQ